MTHADAAFWNGLAEQYAAKPVDDPEAFERKIAVTKGLMRPDHVVADLGCGTGSLALILASDAAQVHGVDISDEMIRIALEKAERQEVANAAFHVQPLDGGLPFEPASLDGICAYSILHLVADRAALLDHIFQTLKPGGFFVTSTVCLRETWWVPYRPLLAVMHWVGKAPRVWLLDKATLAAEIEAAGFVDVEQPDVGAEAIVGFMTARKPRVV